MPFEPDDDDAARMAGARHDAIRLMVRALQHVSILPGHPHKGFIRRVAGQIEQSGQPLSARQEQHVLRLAWRYRRQMPAHLVPGINPDDPLSGERATPWPGRQPTQQELLDG
jgi:hypothetical protein